MATIEVHVVIVSSNNFHHAYYIRNYHNARGNIIHLNGYSVLKSLSFHGCKFVATFLCILTWTVVGRNLAATYWQHPTYAPLCM